jgi:Ribbon-helix-helix protein, copG family
VVIRTQISLTDVQMARLREAATRRRTSIAAIVRDAVDAALAADPHDYQTRTRRALEVVGAFADSAHDVSTDHDAYLEKPIGDPPGGRPGR